MLALFRTTESIVIPTVDRFRVIVKRDLSHRLPEPSVVSAVGTQWSHGIRPADSFAGQHGTWRGSRHCERACFMLGPGRR